MKAIKVLVAAVLAGASMSVLAQEPTQMPQQPIVEAPLKMCFVDISATGFYLEQGIDVRTIQSYEVIKKYDNYNLVVKTSNGPIYSGQVKGSDGFSVLFSEFKKNLNACVEKANA